MLIKRIDKSVGSQIGQRDHLQRNRLITLSDVTFLRTIYEKLSQELDNSKRLSWVKEEFDILKNPDTYSIDPDQSWKKLNLEEKTVIL